MGELDHIVITCRDLDATAAEIEARLGAPMGPVGHHDLMGTHNRLMSLGDSDYLEIIAIDPAAPDPGRARWFGLDNRSGAARLSHWAVRVPDLEAALADVPGAGQALDLTRSRYRWRMAVPPDGELPFAGFHPALLQWQSARPAPDLVDHGLRLAAFHLRHPEIEQIRDVLVCLGLDTDPRLRLSQGAAQIWAEIDTPGGRITLT